MEIDDGEIMEDDEWADDGEELKKPKVPQKVYIEINDKNMDGTPCQFSDGSGFFTSVGFQTFTGCMYGQSGPYTSPEGIQKAIESCKAHITRMGDIPVVRDLRESAKLTRWFT